MEGIKHTIKCRCILSQFRNRSNPPVHEFVVFSVLDDDIAQESIVKCNNCGITHKIIDICRSEILEKSDDWQVVNEEDIKISFSPDLRELLDSYEADLPTLQMAQWLKLRLMETLRPGLILTMMAGFISILSVEVSPHLV